MATGDNIKRIRSLRNLTQEGLAEKAEIGRSALAQYERGRNDPPLPVLRKLASALGVEIGEITDESGARMEPRANLGREVPVARAGYRFVPIYGAITAGMPSANYSDALEWMEMPEWGGEFQRWGRIIEGESMLDPTSDDGFSEDDWAIFEDRKWQSGDGVHAFKEGEDVFKIAWVEGGKTLLRSINPAYPDLDAEGWQIKGVCIRRIRNHGKGVRDVREYMSGFRWRRFADKV